MQNPIDTEMEEFQERESGWSLRSILNLDINIYKYNPMTGRSYIDLPDFIKRKHACVNGKNTDDKCFKWAILSALHSVTKHSYRVSSYLQHEDKHNFSGIEFPVTPKQIGVFEKQNNVSINL